MNFCEDCGAPLSVGILFCENCGVRLNNDTRTSMVEQNSTPPIQGLSNNSFSEQGIIYTNSTLLATQTNVPKETILSVLRQFISDTNLRGIQYNLCDVSNKLSDTGTVKEHIEIIADEYKKSPFTYLFIIGSSSVIPAILWENQACDATSDKDVESDLPYSTFDLQSPFNGQSYDFDKTLCVGRLPNCDLDNYFTNLRRIAKKTLDIHTFALSAEVWQEETKDIYRHIAQGPSVVASPSYTKNSIKTIISPTTNLFLFNLHGSNQTKYWYGEGSTNYPEAVEPDTFNIISEPYFLAVEACYGAYYKDCQQEDSILLSCLGGKCVSFLGSSRIAFGTPAPDGTCADIICGEYLKELKNGVPAGYALSRARQVLIEDSDPETMKTLAEFSLYGDPSLSINDVSVRTTTSAKGGITNKTNKMFESQRIHVAQPDIHRVVRREIISVDQKIANIIEDFVYSQYTEMQNVKPVYYRNAIADSMNAVFTANNKIGVKIINISFTSTGKVKGIMESK